MTTMLFSEIAFVAFWPLTILLLAIYFNPTGKFRTAFWTILTLSVLLSCFVLFQLAGSQSMVGSNFVLVSLLIGGTLFGTFMTLAFVRGVLGFGAPLLNPANISRTKLALSSSLLIPCAIAAVYYSGSRLYKDHVLPKFQVEGRISELNTSGPRKGPRKYYAVIRGKNVYFPKPVWTTLTVGEIVAVQVGRGTNYAYRFERRAE